MPAGQADDPLSPLVEQWHARAIPAIKTKEFIETWIDFLEAWPKLFQNLRSTRETVIGETPASDATSSIRTLPRRRPLCRALSGAFARLTAHSG